MILELTTLGFALASDASEENPESPYWDEWSWECRFEHADRIRESLVIPKLTPGDRMRVMLGQPPRSPYVISEDLYLVQKIDEKKLTLNRKLGIQEKSYWHLVRYQDLSPKHIMASLISRRGDRASQPIFEVEKVLGEQIFLPQITWLPMGWINEDQVREICGMVP